MVTSFQGLHPSARKEMWPLLLGQYSWKSTTAERAAQRKKQADDYHRMKLTWKSISEDQESRFLDFSNRKALVGAFLF